MVTGRRIFGGLFMNIYIRECTDKDLHDLQEICIRTFDATNRDLNTTANITAFLESAINLKKLKQELSDSLSTHLLIYSEGELAGFLKMNCNGAQSESNFPNSLESR
jgi:hypothetical protein